MKKNIVYIMMILIFCPSCDIDLSFYDNEMIWINPYQDGDELVFKSNSNDIENLTIKKVKIWNEDSDSFSSNYNPIYAEVVSREQGSIIKIFKTVPNETKAFFKFKNKFPVYKNLTGVKFSKREVDGKILNCYTIDVKSEQQNLHELVWSKKYGLIEYTDNNRKIWILDKYFKKGKDILRDE